MSNVLSNVLSKVLSNACGFMINSIDKFKKCREFIIMINSDVFNLRIYSYSKFKGGAHVVTEVSKD